jgi:crotonobetainyl-CoA:carnitine CoA-transferase CaiB-like acyl-CoA transferase
MASSAMPPRTRSAPRESEEPPAGDHAGPLDGVLVLDTTEGAQGPWAGALLADLGARVIKVERPGGELMRHAGPYKAGQALPNLGVNHGKENLGLDLHTDEDHAILLALAARADIFMQSWRPGVAARLGLDFPTLQRLNPNLIYASATGFGEGGAYAGKPCVDHIAQAMGGYFHTTGSAGGPPEAPRFIVVDFTSPLTFCLGILLALVARQRFGFSQSVQCSQWATTVALGVVPFTEYALTRTVHAPMGSACSYLVPSQAFRCADTFLVMECPTEPTWQGACQALGLEHLAADPRFATNELRVQNRAELVDQLSARFRALRARRWVARLRAAGVPCAEINWDIEDLYEDPDIVANSLIVQRRHETAGAVRTNAEPWWLSGGRVSYGHLARERDADRESLLAEFAISADADGSSR